MKIRPTQIESMAIAVSKHQHGYLYQQVIDLIRDMRQQGNIKPGDKLPSLRSLAMKLDVSVPTIKQAYIELEGQGLIYAREKSGYFLKAADTRPPSPQKPRMPRNPVAVSRQELIEQVYNGIHQAGNLSLGVANPVAALPASKALNRAMRRVMSVAGDKGFQYGPMHGYEPLRRQIARRYLDVGLNVSSNDIVITNGAQEAIGLALQAVASPGDVVAVESPCYFGILELIESLGMLALELPLCPDQSLCLDDLQKAVTAHPVKAVIISTSLANPLGCWLSNEKKRQIVSFLESRDIALIEDDVYGDLYFGSEKGLPAQLYSQNNNVLTISSFSKTAAPSYRVGWLLAPGYSNTVGRLKRAMSCSAPLLNQWTITEFLRTGEYDRYTRQLRQVLQTNRDRMSGLFQRSLGNRVRLSEPQGGTVLWLEFDKEIDGNQVFREALDKQISVTPGSLFSPSNRYRHCIRVSYGLPWDAGIEQGIATLTSLVP